MEGVRKVEVVAWKILCIIYGNIYIYIYVIYIYLCFLFSTRFTQKGSCTVT